MGQLFGRRRRAAGWGSSVDGPIVANMEKQMHCRMGSSVEKQKGFRVGQLFGRRGRTAGWGSSVNRHNFADFC